jgi:hypothetical protein
MDYSLSAFRGMSLKEVKISGKVVCAPRSRMVTLRGAQDLSIVVDCPVFQVIIEVIWRETLCQLVTGAYAN